MTHVTAFAWTIGAPEVVLILAVILLVFGAARLPKLARSIGASAKEFAKGAELGVDDESGDG